MRSIPADCLRQGVENRRQNEREGVRTEHEKAELLGLTWLESVEQEKECKNVVHITLGVFEPAWRQKTKLVMKTCQERPSLDCRVMGKTRLSLGVRPANQTWRQRTDWKSIRRQKRKLEMTGDP